MSHERVTAMNDFMLADLRESVKRRMNPKRFDHTLGVEIAAEKIGEIYLPDRVSELRCAALLHDVTKNETTEKQLQYLEEFGIMEKDFYTRYPALLHGVSASLIIPKEYPQFVTSDIISAVRWHTTGRAGMSDFEAVIKLADLIEDGREYEDIARIREEFWSAPFTRMTGTEKMLHLYKTVVRSTDNTISYLVKNASYIDMCTVECRNYYLEKIGEIEMLKEPEM